jgi:AcrR family transcriptional regulator
MPTPGRRRLLAAGKELFARLGYGGTSLADIAHQAEASAIELLGVDSKRELLAEILDDGWAEINSRLTDIGIESMNARRAMLAILSVFTHTLERDADFARLMLFDGCQPQPNTGEIVVPDGYRRFMEFCTALAVRGQEEGSFSTALHPRVMASVLVGAAEGLMRDRLIAEQDSGISPYSESQLITAFDTLTSYLSPRSTEDE